jgi:uncharacterized protein DUF2490
VKKCETLVSFIFLILFLIPNFGFAQQDKFGNWIMYFGTFKVGEKLSIHTEFQFRNHTFIPNNTEQLLPRVGLNYHLSDKAIVTAGYAFIPSYVFESEQKSPEFKEHRIWQQFIIRNQIGRVQFDHRYRIEQRWINQIYKNRFRYRLMLFIPLNKSVIEKGSVFLTLYDEIFINSEKTFFDRNRLYGALSYQISKNTSIQSGVLHQQVSAYGKLYFQLALVINADLRREP